MKTMRSPFEKDSALKKMMVNKMVTMYDGSILIERFRRNLKN